MKYCQYAHEDRPLEVRAGYVVNNKAVVDVSRYDPHLPQSLIEIIKNGQIDRIHTLEGKNPPTIPLTDVFLKAPLTGMDKIIGLENNYLDKCQQLAVEPPPEPVFFHKFSSCVTAPCEPLKIRTNVTKKVDWAVALCVVIGKRASNIKVANAYEYVLGCTIAQDITARDWLKPRNGGQLLISKSMDTFCPLGPWIVTLDELGDPSTLEIKCLVNGALKQNGHTSLLVHKVDTVVAYLSSVMTLLPGDLIITGTPADVGPKKCSDCLKPGDSIISDIQNIGLLATTVVEGYKPEKKRNYCVF